MSIAEEYIGNSAHKTIEKHFLHALDGIMSGDGEQAVDAMVTEFEKTASLLRGLAVTEQLRSRISECARRCSRQRSLIQCDLCVFVVITVALRPRIPAHARARRRQ